MKTIALNLKINGVEKSVTNLKQLEEEINLAKEKLKEVELGSDEFNRLAREIENAEGKLKTLNESFTGKGLKERTEAFVKVGEGITTSFAAASAAVQLFGNENEEVSKAALKAQNLLTIAIGARGVAEGLLNLRIVANTVATKAQQIANLGLIGSLRALYATMLANPFTAVAIAIGAVVTALIALGDENEEVSESQEKINEAYSQEAILLEQNLKLLTDQNELRALQLQTIEDLKKTYPGFNAFIDENNKLNKDGQKFLALRIALLKEQAKAQAIINALGDLYVRRLQLQNSSILESVGFWTKLWNNIKAGGNVTIATFNNLKSGLENLREETQKLDDEETNLEEALGGVNTNINDILSKLQPLNTQLENNANATTNAAKAQEQLNKQLQKQFQILQQGLALSKTQIDQQIKFYQDLLNVSRSTGPEPKLLTDLKKINEERKKLAEPFKEQTIFDKLQDIGFGTIIKEIDETGKVTFKLVDEVTQKSDEFGVALQSARNDLQGLFKVTGATEAFRIIEDTRKKFESLRRSGKITPEAFQAISNLIGQYENLGTALRKVPSLVEKLSPEKINKIIEAQRELVSLTGDIKFEFDTDGSIKFIEDYGTELTQVQESAVRKYNNTIAKVFSQPVKTLIDEYRETYLGAPTGPEAKQFLKQFGFSEEQLDTLEGNIDEVIQKIYELTDVRRDSITELLSIIGEEENAIFNYYVDIENERNEAIKNGEDAIRGTILDNLDLTFDAFQKRGGDRLDLIKNQTDQIKEIEETLALSGIDITQFTEEEKLRILEEFLKKQKEARDKARAEELEGLLEGAQKFADFLRQIADVGSQINAFTQESLSFQLEQARLANEQLLSQIVGDTEEANQKREELAQELAAREKEIQKQQLLANLQATFLNATASLAAAIIKVFEATGPLGFVLSGIVAGIGAAQVGLIAQQIQAAQQLRRGGFIRAKNGLLTGASHEQGGIMVAPGIEAEGNEAIINRVSTMRYSGLLNTINQAGNGRPLVVNNFDETRIIEALAKQKSEPIRAYVLEQEITSKQGISKRLEDLSKF